MDIYRELLKKYDYIDNSNIKGFFIMNENSMIIWNKIQEYLNKCFSKINVQPVYYPLLVSNEHMQKEKSHLSNFSPELSWIYTPVKDDADVDADIDVDEEIIKVKQQNTYAIRPTSEAIIYPAMKNKIRSYNDLPKIINQWCSVVRWESSETIPLIRHRELLWQELHGFFATEKECNENVYRVLGFYETLYRDILAVPVILGKKTESEKFSGCDFSTTLEVYIPDLKRSVQAGTAHSLGNKFAKIFDLEYTDCEQKQKNVYQSSCGISIRAIGSMILTHLDIQEKKLVIPPNISRWQVVIVPCGMNENTKNTILEHCTMISKILLDNDIRSYVDIRNETVGYKLNDHECQGVPLRFELGKKDILNNKITICRVDHLKNKMEFVYGSNVETIGLYTKDLLKNIQQSLYTKAYNKMIQSITFVEELKEHNGCICVGFCGETKCEELINSKLNGYKCICIPFNDQIDKIVDTSKKVKCIGCDVLGDGFGLFSKTY